ncbi:MAG: hypothetical protein AB7F89_15495 [Pirellulaceae bacterium]
MSTRRFFRLFAAVLVMSSIASQAHAQRELHNIPPVISADGYDPDLLQPFIEPMAFQPDFQFFAPAEADLLDSEIEAKVGWFGTYDRTYIWVSRPESEASRTQGDFTWGNRIDLGYMTEEDHGWLVSFHHIDGPNAFDILEQERINVFNGDDDVNRVDNSVVLRGDGAGGAIPDPVTPGFPVRDRNDPVTLQRDYRLHDSINVAKLNSFEINKTFRLAPRHYGSVVEPFFGFRYFGFEDHFRRDIYSRFDENGALIYTTAAFNFYPPPDIDTVTQEQFDTFQTKFDNVMFGGQAGLRWYKQKSRWNLSGEVRAFALQNFQSFDTITYTERTVYDGGTPDSAVQIVLQNELRTSGNASEFVFGTEIRGEAAYDMTRYIQLRAGVQFLDFARGIGRGNTLLQNDEDVIMVGATFGLAVNR